MTTVERELSSSNGGERCIGSETVPQVDSLARIVQAMSVVASGKELSTQTIDLSRRHVNYVKHAARLLGLLSTSGELSLAGKKLTSLSGADQVSLLARQFELSACGRAWMNWSNANAISEVDPSSAERFLSEKSTLPPTMVERRGRTLRRWCKDLASGAAHEISSSQPALHKPRAPQGDNGHTQGNAKMKRHASA